MSALPLSSPPPSQAAAACLPSATFERIIHDEHLPLVLRVLALYASRGAWLSHVYITPADRTAQLERSPATIRRTLHQLTAAGYLIATPYPLGRQGGRGIAYRIGLRV